MSSLGDVLCCTARCWPEILVNAHGFANLLALVNDPVRDVAALKNKLNPSVPGEEQKNCHLVDFLLLGWPFPFLYTTREVQREDMK